MAKDPAFLFYPGDWNLGTMHLTLLEKGCYIELLMLQFAKGKFTEANAKHMLNGSFDLAWANISDKFETDGKYYWNKRLLKEQQTRAKFTESRRNNGLIKKSKEKNDEHMLKHMEDEDKSSLLSKKNKELPTLEGIMAIAKVVFGNQIWAEQTCMALNIPNLPKLKDWMRAFNLHISNTDDVYDIDDRKYKKLFIGWVRRKNELGVTIESFKTEAAATHKNNSGAPTLKRAYE